MNKLVLSGYWYCDSLPNGNYVASLFGSPVTLFNGNEVVGHELIYTVLDKSVRFAGVNRYTDATQEWLGNWVDKGVARGARPLYYDSHGELHIVRETVGAPTGSQGWRYVDDNGNPVKSDDTIAPNSPLVI